MVLPAVQGACNSSGKICPRPLNKHSGTWEGISLNFHPGSLHPPRCILYIVPPPCACSQKMLGKDLQDPSNRGLLHYIYVRTIQCDWDLKLVCDETLISHDQNLDSLINISCCFLQFKQHAHKAREYPPGC